MNLRTRQEKHLRSLEMWKCLGLRPGKQHEEEVKSNESPGGSWGLNVCLVTNSTKLGGRLGSEVGPHPWECDLGFFVNVEDGLG